MWIAEFIFIEESDEPDQSGIKYRLALGWRKALYWFKYYGINLVLMLLVMDTTKIFIGGLRPHFLATCKPDKAINCTKE